ncbi:nitrilase-related carbon-nitrogen hydrolase [candidate division KSB1 bacterium]
MMRIGFYQFMPVFGDVERNLYAIEQALSDRKADLIVLPELCTTGYQFISHDEVLNLAEAVPEGPACRRFLSLAAKTGIHIVAGIAEKDGEDLYNSAVLVSPGGTVAVYRKIHLFFEETVYFRPGAELPEVVDIGCAKIGILVCFDWLFPEIFRILAMSGADIIAHPSNLVLPYCQSAMQTRSIENRIFTITSNRYGTEERGGKQSLSFTGMSQITGVRGELLYRAATEGDKLHIVEIDPAEARDKTINRYNAIFESRRPDMYGKAVPV